MLNALLKRFNHHRKEKYFQSPLFHAQKTYAFVGFGIHSMTSLYPILRHFNIRLKYICTKNTDWKNQLSPLFPGCSFIHELQPILDDDTVAGVFVCTTPEAHYDILTRLLKAGKPVFIEKPPCQTLDQLNQLITIPPAAICTVGLQRRHWPGNRAIVKKCREAISYCYQFQTGPLAEGDPFTELFIHPLDYAQYLFGEATLESFSKHEDNKGVTLQLHLTHPGRDGKHSGSAGNAGRTGNASGHPRSISGLLHLSTNYTWNPPVESLSVNTTAESLTIQYPTTVTGKQLPFRVLNIPTERVLGQAAVTKEYFSGIPTLTPAQETNTLYTQGFLPEIEHFVSLVENRRPSSGTTSGTNSRVNPNNNGGASNDLPSLLNLYQLLEKLRKPPVG